MATSNLSYGVFTVAGGTTTQTSSDLNSQGCRGVAVTIKTTVIGTGSITITINGKDEATGAYYLLLSGAAVTTNTTNTYTVYPGVTVAANVAASTCLPRTFQVVATANNANAATYQVGLNLLP